MVLKLGHAILSRNKLVLFHTSVGQKGPYYDPEFLIISENIERMSKYIDY